MGISKHQRQLYELFYSYALSICFRYTRDKENAVEIMNDGFVKVFRGLPDFSYALDLAQVKNSFTCWIKKIMIHTAIDHERANQSPVTYVDMNDPGQHKHYGTTNPVDNLGYKELIEMIQSLSPGYRMVFNLYVIDGFSHDEIASMLNISANTSRSNLSKAKERLREMLKTRYEEIATKYN